jgi:hypothetical protein
MGCAQDGGLLRLGRGGRGKGRKECGPDKIRAKERYGFPFPFLISSLYFLY